jgi:hypothetical protein
MLQTLMHRLGISATAISCVLGLAVTAQAVVVVNDTWKDDLDSDPASPTYSENGNDADADGDLESAWFQGGAGSLNPVAGAPAGPLRGDITATTGSASWTTYFAPEATPVTLTNPGDTMKVTWVFSMTNVSNDTTGTANNGQNFRIGVMDTPDGSRLSANGSPGAAAYTGYSMFMNVDQTLRRTTPFELRERNGGAAGFLSASGDWTSLIDDGATGDPGYMDGVVYTYTMTMTYNESLGLDITSRMEGTGLGPMGQGFLQTVYSDPSPNTLTYDTFGLRPSGTTATNPNSSAFIFDTTLFKVELTGAPVVGDANFDNLGGVNGNDLLIWQRGLGTGTDNATGDANGDFSVTAADLAIWKGQYGSASVAAASAVPEPSALVGGVMTLIALAGVRRRAA